MTEKSETGYGPIIGFPGLLVIALMVLKLCHVIDWSWWWITAPMWAGFVIVVLLRIFLEIFKLRH